MTLNFGMGTSPFHNSPDDNEILLSQGTRWIPGVGIIKWLGTWNSGITYLANDVVSEGGKSYICILGHINQQPPNATYWDVMSGTGGMTNITITADSGTNQDVADSEIMDIEGGNGISTVVGATRKITVTADHDTADNYSATEHFTEASIDHTNITAGDGSDHADVVTNSTHSAGNGADHSLLTAGTSYWSCNATAFRGQAPDTADFIFNEPYGYLTMQGAAYMFAEVQLPQGAIVTGAVVTGSAGTEDKTWVLTRRVLTSLNTNVEMASAAVNTEDTSITSATIDNSLYAYFFRITLAATEIIYGARVKYTTNYV